MQFVEFIVPPRKKISLNVSFDSSSKDENEIIVIEKTSGQRLFNTINFEQEHARQWESPVNDSPIPMTIVVSAQHKPGGANAAAVWVPSALVVGPSSDKDVHVEVTNGMRSGTSVSTAKVSWR
ncbi:MULTISPECIES: hypothetical protein [Myxococcus]|uniref:hypothetical protein n=1 Tax=Myxococcus TaxID=32 RepID=UPI0013D2B84C|nr:MULTISPECIES: hypothetical protein [Myxococcus]NVJ22074.1 hypothetical protein [Myxococcus sp. AM011]